jgi:hypothetical protein
MSSKATAVRRWPRGRRPIVVEPGMLFADLFDLGEDRRHRRSATATPAEVLLGELAEPLPWPAQHAPTAAWRPRPRDIGREATDPPAALIGPTRTARQVRACGSAC